MRQGAPAVAIATAIAALALLTYFQFPGHTWLQQDSQIYAPILDHQRDPLALRNDIAAPSCRVYPLRRSGAGSVRA
jgi:hypothetical protein